VLGETLGSSASQIIGRVLHKVAAVIAGLPIFSTLSDLGTYNDYTSILSQRISRRSSK
jgi:hypothetical protein